MKISKKTAKIINVIVIALAIALIVGNFSAVNAWSGFDQQIQASSSTLSGSATTIAGTILGVVQVIGMAVAVIMLIVLAIKYISAAPNDKAEIKKHAVVYIVGAVILFAASGIVEIIKNFSNTAIK